MDVSRRMVLALGGSALVGAVSGCLQFTDPDAGTATETRAATDTPTPTATPTPSVEDVLDDETLTWLGSEATESYSDRLGSDTVTVTVGDSEEFDQEFTPAVLRVEVGTTVRWGWTGDGGVHNVVSADDETVEASQAGDEYEIEVGDGPIDSGSATGGSDTTYEHTFESSGTYRYYCQPHYPLGARGVVVVVSTM